MGGNMSTCPDCGSMVMNGDSYCTHCGAHLKWSSCDEPDTGSSYSNISEISLRQRGFFLNNGDVSETYLMPDEETLDDIVNGVCITPTQKMQLKAQIREYMKSTDFNGFYIQKDYGFEVYYFHFIQENEYVKTTHVMTYVQDLDYYNPYRTFYESYSEHSHEKLLANPSFKSLVETVGLEFSGCGGGYECYLKQSYLDVTLTDKIRIRVYFTEKNKRRVYYLDLACMQLNPDYNEYDIEEMRSL